MTSHLIRQGAARTPGSRSTSEHKCVVLSFRCKEESNLMSTIVVVVPGGAEAPAAQTSSSRPHRRPRPNARAFPPTEGWRAVGDLIDDLALVSRGGLAFTLLEVTLFGIMSLAFVAWSIQEDSRLGYTFIPLVRELGSECIITTVHAC